ncbi:TonB-dependent receptor [Gallaecimonas sp. GXIMD1310]|uniref:TonB-dependent receptor n=1 Tax=Gallaecimonas sp. GXIMD1310 TaxID=3131926 RepID=UPI00324B4464
MAAFGGQGTRSAILLWYFFCPHKVDTFMGIKPTLLALSLAPLLAQASDEHLLVLGRVPAIQEQLPAAAFVLDHDAIARSGASSLAALLNGRFGLSVSDSGSGPVLSLRGFSPEQSGSNVLVLVDGQRLNSQSLAGPDLSTLVPARIERIEVLSGSAGVLYGDQAVAGVVNIITRSGSDVSIETGSQQRRGVSASTSTHLSKQWRLSGSGHWLQGAQGRAHSHYNQARGQLQLAYHDAQQQLSLAASAERDHRQQPGPLLASTTDANATLSEFADDFMARRGYSLRAAYQRQLDEKWTLWLDASSLQRLRNYRQSYLNYPVSTVYHARETQHRLAPRLQGQWANVTVLTGIDASTGQYQDNLLAASNRRQLLSPYASGQWQSGHWQLQAGLRYSYLRDRLQYGGTYPQAVNINHHASTWALSGQYKRHSGRLYWRAVSSVRFAKLDEQGYTPAGQVGLKPQRGLSLELGWQQGRWQLSAFRLTLADEIVFDPNAPAPAGGLFPGANVNKDRSRRYGLHLSGSQPLGPVTLGLDYQYLDARYTAGLNSGKQVPWVSRQQALLSAEWAISAHWRSRLEWQLQSQRYLVSDNANAGTPAPGRGVVALVAQWQKGHWQLSARADNLFNITYAAYALYSAWGENSWYPATGRQLNLTLHYAF